MTILETILIPHTAEVLMRIYRDLDQGITVTIGTHTCVLDLDTAKALRDQLKVAIGSVE